MAKLNRAVTAPDGPVWGDDSLEIFLSPTAGHDYFQFIVGRGGRSRSPGPRRPQSTEQRRQGGSRRREGRLVRGNRHSMASMGVKTDPRIGEPTSTAIGRPETSRRARPGLLPSAATTTCPIGLAFALHPEEPLGGPGKYRGSRRAWAQKSAMGGPCCGSIFPGCRSRPGSPSPAAGQARADRRILPRSPQTDRDLPPDRRVPEGRRPQADSRPLALAGPWFQSLEMTELVRAGRRIAPEPWFVRQIVSGVAHGEDLFGRDVRGRFAGTAAAGHATPHSIARGSHS